MGADYEFDTLRINPEFKQKIERLKKEGRFKVCIFDDYMTHGNTFNAVRNLLKHLGADKIIFVSLGNFSHPFRKKTIKLQVMFLILGTAINCSNLRNNI